MRLLVTGGRTGDLGRHVVCAGEALRRPSAYPLRVVELTGSEPDLERWTARAMPDVITVSVALR